MATIERDALDELFAALRKRGYEVIGPTVRDGAIVYDEIATSADLPVGWTDEQDGGTYRLRRRDDEALFGYAVGPQSWKRFLHPPEVKLWRARRAAPTAGSTMTEEERRPAGLRVHRRPLLRAARDRDPGPRAAGGRLSRIRSTGRAARAPSSSPSTAPSPAAPASASRWTPGPAPSPATTSR